MDETRIIWGKWDCSNCGTKALSAEPPPGEVQPRCPNCGSAREDSDGETPYLDNQMEAETGRVLDANIADTEEELAIAKADADWQCGICKADNRALRNTCVSCGASKNDARKPSEPQAPVSAAVPPQSPSKTMRWVALGCCALVGYGVWRSRTHEVSGRIERVHWEQISHLERFTRQTKEGWRQELRLAPAVLPVNGAGENPGVENIRNCRDKFHHNERYVCGTDYVCHTRTRSVPDGQSCSRRCSQQSNRNGSFTETCRDECTPRYRNENYEECGNETRYCDRAINLPWCSYDTYAWTELEAKTASGENLQTSWPAVTIGALDRVRKEGRYLVELNFGKRDKTHTVNPSSEQEFRLWRPGDEVLVVEANSGKIEKVLRSDQIEDHRRTQGHVHSG